MSNKSMWNNEAVKAYESGQGVMMVKEPHPHYVPIPQRTWVGLDDDDYKVLREGVVKQGKPIAWMIEQIEAKLKEKNSNL